MPMTRVTFFCDAHRSSDLKILHPKQFEKALPNMPDIKDIRYDFPQSLEFIDQEVPGLGVSVL